jgi:hypothetical protein
MLNMPFQLNSPLMRLNGINLNCDEMHTLIYISALSLAILTIYLSFGECFIFGYFLPNKVNETLNILVYILNIKFIAI